MQRERFHMKSGIDTSFIDPSVRVQDDLFRHFNGTWLKVHEIPADRASDGVFYKLHEEAEGHVKAIIEGNAEGNDSQKISDLYGSFMDTQTIERLGVSPIAGYLERVDQIRTCSDFLRTLGEFECDRCRRRPPAATIPAPRRRDRSRLPTPRGRADVCRP